MWGQEMPITTRANGDVRTRDDIISPVLHVPDLVLGMMITKAVPHEVHSCWV